MLGISWYHWSASKCVCCVKNSTAGDREVGDTRRRDPQCRSARNCVGRTLRFWGGVRSSPLRHTSAGDGESSGKHQAKASEITLLGLAVNLVEGVCGVGLITRRRPKEQSLQSTVGDTRTHRIRSGGCLFEYKARVAR